MNHDHPHKPPRDPADLLGGSPAAPPPPEPDQESSAIEDSSTRALADALRSSFSIVKVLMAGLVVIFLFSGVLILRPDEQAIIFRLGKPVGTPETMLRGPGGLHWAFPYPIDDPERISIGQIQSVESTVGWYSEIAGFESLTTPSLNPATEGYTLTADGNIIHARATLRYRITDPVRYAFHFVDAPSIVQNALDNALLYASAQYSVDRAIRLDIHAFRETVAARLNQLVYAHDLGVTLEPPEVRTRAPRQVEEKFNEVAAAAQDSDRTILEARRERETMLSKAQSDASRILDEAETDRLRLVSSVASEAQYLTDRLPEYRKNPDLFEQRLLTETMLRVLTNVQEKVFIPDIEEGQSGELRILLSREPQRLQTPENQQPR